MSYTADPDALDIPWFDSPFFESLIQSEKIAAEIREAAKAYARDGYLIFDPEIPDSDAVFARIIQSMGKRYEGRGRLLDAWTIDKDVRSLALLPKVLSFLKQLYRREPIAFQTLNFCRGTEQRAHSDTVHFSCVPEGFMCGVWIALEDIDENNGPLILYPGSHRLPAYTYTELGLSTASFGGMSIYERYEIFLEDLIRVKGLQEKKVLLKKGQAVLWAANILHGGSPILDPSRSRHSQVTHYFFEGCTYYTPKRSDPFMGKVYRRKIHDIRTGRVVPHVYKGSRVRVAYSNDGIFFRLRVFLTAQLRSLKRKMFLRIKTK